jgi:hypothetical protein
MELIHPKLPIFVQRTFAYDLQRMTLKDLQPQIVDALDGFWMNCRMMRSRLLVTVFHIKAIKGHSANNHSEVVQPHLPLNIRKTVGFVKVRDATILVII